MRSVLATAVLVFAATAAFGGAFYIEPIAPDTHSFVTITLGGGWPDSCVPTAAQTTVLGNTITILVQPSLVVADTIACAPLTSPWVQTVNLGMLDAGTYTVHAFLQTSSNRADLGAQQFTVRPAEPFRAIPPGAPVAGGTQIRLVSPDVWPTNEVRFGESSPVQASQAGNVLFVTVPPHAPGTVDIKVGVQTAIKAFTYYDPSAPADPSVFEMILFPIAYSGSGAFGSSWVTDNVISGDGAKPVRIDTTDPAGVVFYAGRGTLSSSALSSRIRDVTRQAQSAGTEIKIVRESDWRLGSVKLTNIPAAQNARTMLRIWGDHDRPVSVTVEASVNNRALVASVSTGLTRQGNGLLYAQIDLGELVSRIPSTLPREVTIKYTAYDPDVRLWALATITNDDTQQVTAIWPQ